MKRRIFVLAFILLIPGTMLSAIEYAELVARLDDSPAMREAALDLSLAENAWVRADAIGAISAGLAPALSADEDAVEVALGISASVPLIAGAQERLDAASALRDLETAREAYDRARLETEAELFGLYAAAFLAQETAALRESQLVASEAALDAMSRQFEQGRSSFSELNRTRQETADARNSLLQAQMDYRLSWFALAQFTGIDASERPALEAPEAITGPLPQLMSLTAAVYDASPQLAALEDRLADALAAGQADSPFNASAALRFGLSFPDQGVNPSLTFNTVSGDLSAAVDVPLYRFEYGDVASGSGSADTEPGWNAELSVSLTYGGGREVAAADEASDLGIAVLELQIGKTMGALDIQLRSLYQRYQLAISLAESARQDAALAASARDTLELRTAQGSAAAWELLEAGSSAQAAELSVIRADLAAAQAYLDIYRLAGFSGALRGEN
jgi:outer membrane protein TolC